MTVNTFGCGEFLPGRGPFNFPDFVDGGNVNEGDPPGPDPPGTSTDADPFGGPIVVGEGPPNPGPQPRPVPPGPPGTVEEDPLPPEINFCRCIIITEGSPGEPQTNSQGDTVYQLIFEQTCKKLPSDTPNPNGAKLDKAVQELQALYPGGVATFPNGKGFTDCNTNPPGVPIRCGGQCDAIELIYTVPGKPVPPYNDPEPRPRTPGGGPPTATINKCVYVGAEPLKTFVSDTPQGVTYSLSFTQKCKQFPIGTPNPNTARLTSWITANYPPPSVVTIEGAGYEDCPGGTCDPILGTLFIPRDITNEGDPVPLDPTGPPFRPLPDQDPFGPSPLPGNNIDATSIGELPEGPGATGVPDNRGGPGGTYIGEFPEGPGATGVPDNRGGPGGTYIGEFPDASSLNPRFPGEGATNFSVNFEKISPKKVGLLIDEFETVDLSDPILSNYILSKRPSGFEDEEIFFNDTPKKSVKVINTSKITDIFSRYIDDNFLYMLENQYLFGDWDSSRAGSITIESVYNNLNLETKDILSKIINYDRSPLSKVQIFGLIGSRILDGTVKNINKAALIRLQRASSEEKPLQITRSKSSIVNETVALGLVEKNYYSLEPSSYSGRAAETMKNRKTLSSDIDRYIEVSVGGVTQRYYVNDDDTFVDRSTLALKDGEYFDITIGGEITRLYSKSEKDHAYLVPEKTKQIALNILGGDIARTLTVSGDPKGIELDYSLSSPRQDIYFLSCVLSSISTAPNTQGNRHIKNTTARYENVSLQDIDEINEYIKYKENHQTFILDDEDLILDYVERSNQLFLSQNDILVDSPKENKTLPLLTRQIPWYILLYPTNNPENNPFNVKSQIVNITPSSNLVGASVTRQLRTRTSINPKFRNTTGQFISTDLVGREGRDVYQQETNQARINKLNLNNINIKSGYLNNNKNIIAAEEYTPARKKTGLRLLAEIVTEIDNNYLLGLNGIGKSITEFDVLSRLNFNQFNTLSRLENFQAIKNSIFNGMISDVKVTPGTKYADSKLAVRKTQLVRRKSTAPKQDQYPEIKSTNSNRSIQPPTTEDPPRFVSYQPPSQPTAFP